jgi:glutathionylspermidine synthase|uniref:Uncharacterized protein n=1 Tax=viral metagenome TaxID=1070528 RepID=A0A6C0BLC2_9ZZZZ
MIETPKIVLKLNQNWLNQFKILLDHNKLHARCWFWDHFDWEKQSLWIGKFIKTNHLPNKNEQINEILHKLITDFNSLMELKSDTYLKIYFSRNAKSDEPEINYLLICNTHTLPESFNSTLVDVMFEKYQLTEAIINKNINYKQLIDHYINWDNNYTYYDLMGELNS